jgi:integrase
MTERRKNIMELTEQEYEMFKQLLRNYGQAPLKPIRREKGTGSVVNLGKGRRKPYGAFVTINGKQKALAYFSERNQAEKCLDMYQLERHKNINSGSTYTYAESVNANFPRTGILIANMTMADKVNAGIEYIPSLKEVFEDTLNDEWLNKSKNTRLSYSSAVKKFKKYFDMPINMISLKELNTVFNALKEKGTSESLMTVTKSAMSTIFDHAIKYDYCNKNYAKFIVVADTRSDEAKAKNIKQPYSEEDIEKIRAFDNDPIAQFILITVYTGMRPSEVLKVSKKNIHLNEKYMIGGIKTVNGINRTIPIHDSILKYIEPFMNSSIKSMTYTTLLYKYNAFLAKCGIDESKYTPHCGRHTFPTLSKKYRLDETVVSKIMGHSRGHVTEDVYTHISLEDMLSEVSKLPSKF